MTVRVISNLVISGQTFEVDCFVLLKLNKIWDGEISLSLGVLIHVNIYLISLNANHDRRSAWVFRRIGAFGFGKRFEDFEEPCHFFIFRDGLFVQSMKPIVDSDDLVEDRCLGGKERVCNL